MRTTMAHFIAAARALAEPPRSLNIMVSALVLLLLAARWQTGGGASWERGRAPLCAPLAELSPHAVVCVCGRISQVHPIVPVLDETRPLVVQYNGLLKQAVGRLAHPKV